MDETIQNKGRPRRLVYIMGPNYSGSTLLTLLMANHPQIATVGELKASSMADAANYHCSCGKIIMSCPFWTRVSNALLEQGHQLSFYNFKTHFRHPKNVIIDTLLRASLRFPLFEFFRELAFTSYPTANRARKDIVARNKLLIDTICHIQQAGIFLDDSKEPIRLYFFLSSNIWDIYVIRIVRDGRGVTNSYMRHTNSDMPKAAREWAHTERECDRIVKLLEPHRYFSIQYENLCQSPEETINKVYLYLGLQPIGYPVLQGDKHILGNQMRVDSLEEIRIDEKWKSTLSIRDLAIFSSIAGNINQLRGYL